jgi:hypothetical protein
VKTAQVTSRTPVAAWIYTDGERKEDTALRLAQMLKLLLSTTLYHDPETEAMA